MLGLRAGGREIETDVRPGGCGGQGHIEPKGRSGWWISRMLHPRSLVILQMLQAGVAHGSDARCSESRWARSNPENTFIERFDRTFRVEVLDPTRFDSVEQMRAITARSLESDNTEWPNEGLGRGC